MKTSLPLTMARRLGIGLAICVPALVVAQPTLPNFGRNQVLLAEQLNSLVSAINATRDRVDILQANAADPIVKGDGNSAGEVYEEVAESPPTAQNANALAQATCRDADDVMLTCGCQGTISGEGSANQQQFDLRTVNASNRLGGASFCTCQGLNVGDAQTRVLVARASCITVQ